MVEQARYTLKEVASRDGRDGASTWIVINDMIYDVTNYKMKHPGGPELIEEYAGQDATSGFEDFGHSSDAKRLLKSYLVGELVEEDKMIYRKKKNTSFADTKLKATKSSRRSFLSILCGNCTS